MKHPLFIASIFWLAASAASAQERPLDASELLLQRLTNAHGVSGFEGEVREILRSEWSGLVADLHADGIGNLLATLPGSSEGPKVLLMAHMDEVGFLVRYVDDDGFIYLNNVGGYFAQSVLTQRLSILTRNGPVLGYTGMKSGHILRPEERGRMIPLEQMFVDVGAGSRAEVEALGIRPGLPVAYATEFALLGDTGRYLAKAWDDRVGLAAITEALRRLNESGHPNTVQIAATVQEEIGLRGAAVVYESFEPDIVINLEIGIASDFPLLTSKTLSQEELGDGPAVFVFDGSMIPNDNFVEWIRETAGEHDIPVQFESVSGYGEDAAELQKSGQGVPAINLGVPTRYGHSQSGVVDRSDYDHTVELIVRVVQGLTAEAVAAIRRF